MILSILFYYYVRFTDAALRALSSSTFFEKSGAKNCALFLGEQPAVYCRNQIKLAASRSGSIWFRQLHLAVTACVIYARLAYAGKAAYATDAELRQYSIESIRYQYLSVVNPNDLSGDVGYPLNAAGIKN